MGEALKCGTKLADLCWELERGQYKVLGGPKAGAGSNLTGQAKKDWDKAAQVIIYERRPFTK